MESPERVMVKSTNFFEPREVDTINGFSQNDIFTQALGLADRGLPHKWNSSLLSSIPYAAWDFL